jgi:hypothetical protein
MRLLTLTLVAAAAAWADTAAGIRWTVPNGWKSVDRPMRVATYLISASAGDSEGGECTVFFFGSGQGGSVEANIQRWAAQFDLGGAKPVPKKRTINGLAVTTMEMEGTFLAGAPMGPKVKKPGFRMLGAIVEAPDGTVFFKLTGPSKTVAASEAGFHSVLQSLGKK